jgi:FkbM family methyltransferase
VRNNFVKRFSRRLRGHWRRKSLGEHGVAIVAETKNGLLAVPVGDVNGSRSLLVNGEYDWPQIQWLAGLLDASSRLIFAGAHIGAVLVPIVRAAAPRSVIAYEPSPRNFLLLNMNLRLNSIVGVAARKNAVGERPCSVQFTENSINTGNSRVARAGEIQVAMETLDRTVPGEWDAIDLIVMDIEGTEVAAMRGAQAILSRTRNLYVEYAPEQLREQGSSAAEFVEAAQKYFKSAYVFGSPILFLGPGKFAAHLIELQDIPGLLLNVLFTQDAEANPKRMTIPLATSAS